MNKNSLLSNGICAKKVLNPTRPGKALGARRQSLSLGKCFFVACCVLWSFSAQAQESRQEQTFKNLREKSKQIDNLSTFLRMYMGDCQAGPEAATCRQQSAVFRQEANQHSHVFFVFEEAIALELRSASQGQLSIGWLPFFSAFGYAISAHPPKQWNKEGQPIYTYMHFRGQLPSDLQMDEVSRWHKVGRLAAEVIVVPKGSWKASGKGKTVLEGMKVTWKAIRIFDSRTGQTLGIWLG